jgi:hypothetical protein
MIKMEFYEVTNNNWHSGYFRLKENAEKEVQRINDLTIELIAKGSKNLDTKPFYVVTHKFEDELI